MGYEIWDRDHLALIGDFDELEQALDFLRAMVQELNVAQAARELDRFQLVKVTNEGRAQEVISEGVDLLPLLFAPAIAAH